VPGAGGRDEVAHEVEVGHDRAAAGPLLAGSSTSFLAESPRPRHARAASSFASLRGDGDGGGGRCACASFASY
jgi:hypothetical protein